MWRPPESGDIVWCRFPQRPRDVPEAKPRPVLVMMYDHLGDGIFVEVAYGTSQPLGRMYTGCWCRRQIDPNADTALSHAKACQSQGRQRFVMHEVGAAKSRHMGQFGVGANTPVAVLRLRAMER
jgi:hypothetical protein